MEIILLSFFVGLRKLMNRIAAQNARDRKKNFVEDLERRVAELEAKVYISLPIQFTKGVQE